MRELINRTSTSVGNNLCKNEAKIKAAEQELEIIKTRSLMETHLRMDALQYDAINRKLSIYDIELGARDLIMRLDLDVPLSKFVAPPKIQEVLSQGRSEAGPAGTSVKGSKLNDKKSEVESQVSASPLGQEEDYWKTRTMLDHSWVKKTVKELKFCMERMANRVFVIGNLGEHSGRIRGENSMRIIQHALQQHIDDFPVHFLAEANIPDFLEKKQMDEYADNCIYVVENLNFYPEEFGTYEPKVDEKDETKESQGKVEEEEKKEEVAAPVKPISRQRESRNEQSRGKLQSQPLSEEKAQETPDQ